MIAIFSEYWRITQREWKCLLSTWEKQSGSESSFLVRDKPRKYSHLSQSSLCTLSSGNSWISLLLWIPSFLLNVCICVSIKVLAKKKVWEIFSYCKCVSFEYFIRAPILLTKHLLPKIFFKICNYQAKTLDNKYRYL